MKFDQSFWRRRFFCFVNVFSLFCNYPPPPLGKGRGPLFEQTLFPFIQGCILPSLVEVGPVFFLITSIYFLFLVIISPLKRTGAFISTKKAHFSLQLRWDKKLSLHFRLCVYIFPQGKLYPFILTFHKCIPTNIFLCQVCEFFFLQ